MVKLVCGGTGLVSKAVNVFTGRKTNAAEFIAPFLIFKTKKNHQHITELEEISETCVKSALESLAELPDYFILAGETQVDDPKTGAVQSFFVVKLYFTNAPQGYIYSIPFSVSEDNGIKIDQIRYVGSDENCYLPFTLPEGEGSSCNAIKMDPKHPYEYRAAFLVGHINETRLWHDVNSLVTDMYCKLGPDTSRQYELIFEISRFGKMTNTMTRDYKTFKEFFDSEIAPSFPHIRGEIQMGNN